MKVFDASAALAVVFPETGHDKAGPRTRALGLSLGDRCCLALAEQHPGAQVVTADRPWKGLKGFRLVLIR